MSLQTMVISTLNKASAKASKVVNSKHMPTVLLAIGIGAGAVTVYTAAKETLNVEDILDETKQEIDDVKSASEEPDKAELAKIYIKTGAKLLKNYYPSIIFGATSVTCILASHGLLHMKTAQTVAAYNTLDSMFKRYRENVIEKYGEQEDKRLRFGLKEQKVDVVTYDENGNEIKSKKKVMTYPSDFLDTSEYARFWGKYNDGVENLQWEAIPESNAMFLQNTQRYANDLLNLRGHLFLNEVYDMLGFKRTRSGQIVGWVKDKDGDGVRFGIDNIYRAIANGEYEESILLDFNVQGAIIDKV